MTSSLIDATDLLKLLRDRAQEVLLLDASFDLADTAAGERDFESVHLPGAIHVHLDRDLSAPKTGSNGRHPLPQRDAFARRMAALGADEAMTIVAYDRNGSMYAARLWWMLRWVGHAEAAVLDGGLAAWLAGGMSVESGPARTLPPGRFPVRAPLEQTVDYATLRNGLEGQARLIVDARASDRFRGENETLDPVGGRIPGAVNRCFRDNLEASGCFKPAELLRAEWLQVIGDRPSAELVQQCGSGVTACHNLLALHAAGLSGSVLYPGSWSEWCAQPGAPVARG